MNNLIKVASRLPLNKAVPTVSIAPITLSSPARHVPLELRITLPLHGDKIPVVLLSHGHGPSLYIPSRDGYAPLANFYAEHGFAVIQPTHLNSKIAGAPANAEGGPLFWRSRIEDMKLILDHIDEIQETSPVISGRLDASKIAAVGHSFGGQTVGLLLGAKLTDHKDPSAVDVGFLEQRIKAGILLAAPGKVDDSSTELITNTYSFLNPDFSQMKTQALVVCGDDDPSKHFTSRGSEWHADPFHFSSGNKSLLTIVGGGHSLGGIPGWDAKETTDESPERLAIVQRMTWAYLWSTLNNDTSVWSEACEALEEFASDEAKIEHKT